MMGMKRKLINDYKMNPCYVILFYYYYFLYKIEILGPSPHILQTLILVE